MDLPDVEVKLTICAIQDGVTWQTGKVDWYEGGWMTIWIDGLSPEADAGNTTVLIEDIPHQPDIVLAEKGQVNVRLRPLIAPGSRQVIVVHRGSRSCPATVRVVGSPPDIRGLGGLAGHRD